jgi:RHS repeat-associated protein
MTDATGTTAWGYDTHKRLVSENGPFDDNDTVGYDYSATTGFRNTLTTPGHALTFTPDAMGRISTIAVTGSTFAYSYLGRSRQVDTVARGNQIVDNAFDNLGRLTSKTNKKAADGTTTVNSYAYVLNNADQRTKTTFADGRYWDYTYDDAGQLTDAVLKDPANAWLATHGYDYDAMGNPTRHKESGQVREYTFNNLNQFDTASRSIAIDVHGQASPHQADPTVTVQGEEDESPVAATVDAEGKFVRKDVPLADGENAITVNVTDKYGRTTSGVHTIDVTLATGTPTFSYDDNGNTTGDGTFTYTWNDENRLVAVAWETEAANISLAYLYDGLGRRRRATKTVQPKAGGSPAVDERLFVYDGNNLVAELLPNHSITRKYVWGLDLSGTLRGAAGVGGLLSVSNTAATYYPTYDANGNITAYLDASDDAVYTAEYSPFGKITATTGTAPCQFGFSTIYRDAETGFLAYRFRDYDPNLGRWLSRDPIGEMGGYNLYGFVGNDGVNWVDLFGLADEECCDPDQKLKDLLTRMTTDFLQSLLDGAFDSGVVEDVASGLGKEAGSQLKDINAKAMDQSLTLAEVYLRTVNPLLDAVATFQDWQSGAIGANEALAVALTPMPGGTKPLRQLDAVQDARRLLAECRAGKTISRSLDDISSLRGASEAEVRSLIPEGWIEKPLKKGEGVRFINPDKPGEAVFIERGWPGATDPLHAGPYLRVSRDGKITRIPMQGSSIL